MELRRELSLTLGALVLLNVLLALGAIGLLIRMGPAIERILQEHVPTIVACEEILAVLAESDAGPLPESGRIRVEAALQTARGYATDREEQDLLETLDAVQVEFQSDPPAARALIVERVRSLIAATRRTMEREDREARRLSRAGSWAAVLVAFISFALSLALLGRLRRRLIAPLMALHAALEAARQGEHFRRCPMREGPLELRQVLESVNALLDERLRSRAASGE